MAIKDWHGGQLVVFCVGVGAFGSAGLYVAFAIANEIEYPASAYLGFSAIAIAVMLFALVLTVVWKWFGGRKN